MCKYKGSRSAALTGSVKIVLFETARQLSNTEIRRKEQQPRKSAAGDTGLPRMRRVIV